MDKKVTGGRERDELVSEKFRKLMKKFGGYHEIGLSRVEKG
jgi:hypothetical protein